MVSERIQCQNQNRMRPNVLVGGTLSHPPMLSQVLPCGLFCPNVWDCSRLVVECGSEPFTGVMRVVVFYDPIVCLTLSFWRCCRYEHQ